LRTLGAQENREAPSTAIHKSTGIQGEVGGYYNGGISGGRRPTGKRRHKLNFDVTKAGGTAGGARMLERSSLEVILIPNRPRAEARACRGLRVDNQDHNMEVLRGKANTYVWGKKSREGLKTEGGWGG